MIRNVFKKNLRRTIQDGRSLTSRDCSSQGRRGELEDTTLSDKFWSLREQKIPSGGNTRVASATLVTGAAVPPAPWRGSSRSRVNRFGGPARVPSRTPEPGAAAVMAPPRDSARRGPVPLLTEVWSPGKAESPITDTRRKPDRRILGRKAPSVLTPPFWPWELTTWTSTQET